MHLYVSSSSSLDESNDGSNQMNQSTSVTNNHDDDDHYNRQKKYFFTSASSFWILPTFFCCCCWWSNATLLHLYPHHDHSTIKKKALFRSNFLTSENHFNNRKWSKNNLVFEFFSSLTWLTNIHTQIINAIDFIFSKKKNLQFLVVVTWRILHRKKNKQRLCQIKSKKKWFENEI